MAFVDANYPLSELTGDVIAGFYRTYDAFGFGFLESVYRRALSVELKLAGLGVEREVPFELFHLGEAIGRYRADLIIEKTLIVEIKTGRFLDSEAIPQVLNYLNVTRLPLGLILFFGPKPKVKRVILDSTREYPVISRLKDRSTQSFGGANAVSVASVAHCSSPIIGSSQDSGNG
ncbi:MAG TPA: GxxExxY protein [Gemmatimonadaceae bacterium]|jgi:GxxExxY protein